MREKFRCHPSIILENISGIFIFLILLTISSYDDIAVLLTEGGVIIIMSILVLLSFIIIYNILIWYKTYISIEENTIIIKRNTIVSNENTYGIKNISSINLDQNVFERMIGTYKVKIDTDSLSTANDTDIEIVLSKEKAYEFKKNILGLMNMEKSKSIDNENKDISCDAELDFMKDDDIEYDLVYSTKDIIKHCLYSLQVRLIIFYLVVFLFTTEVLKELEGISSIGLSVIPIGIGILQPLIGNLLKYHKFSIKRLEDRLYISYGMFKKRKYTVPVNRINAINIKQSTISRIFKRYSVDIVTIGVGDDVSEGSKILLSSNREDFIKNIKILLPEISLGDDIALQKESKKSLIIRFFNITIYMTILGIVLYFITRLNYKIPYVFILGLVIFLGGLLIFYMIYITRGIYLGEDKLIISCGVFTKKISIIKYKKIQYMNVHKTPISSKLNLCNGKIYILASLGNDMRAIGYYDEDLFEKLGKKIISN